MKEKNNGVSLVYVLIVLSIISVFSISFVYFVKQKSETNLIKNKFETDTTKEYLLFLEEENAKKIAQKNISFKIIDYFDSIKVINNGNAEYQKLIFHNENTESVGNFKIKKIIDNEGKEYKLPLEKNVVYKDLEIVYTKKVLNVEILFKEEMKFKRIDTATVDISVNKKINSSD